MANSPQGDHTLITILLFIIGTVATVIGVLVRGWFKHVNDNFKEVFARLKASDDARIEEGRAREKRWIDLKDHCSEHAAKLSELKGKLNGKRD